MLLPEGVGYRLHAGQVMHLELRYINLSTQPVDVVARVDLFPSTSGTEVQDGAVLLVGTTDIDIPAHAAHRNDL